MDTIITKFIKTHHVLTLASSKANIPWCCNCFYAFLEKDQLLVFSSDEETRHVKEAQDNPHVAASIVLETRVVGKVQGVQMEGRMRRPETEEEGKVKKAYFKRFPYALAMNPSLWVLELQTLKMTHNQLGFGKKLHWKRESQAQQ